MNRKPRAIVLEDDRLSQQLLSAMLESRGYDVITYDNPSICPLQRSPECRCTNDERCTDILMSDLNMPLVSGLEYIQNQRIKGCKCKTVALVSGEITYSVEQKAKRLACQLFPKPVNIKDIFGWLDSVEKDFDYDVKLSNWFAC